MKFKAWLKLARLHFYAFPAIAEFAGTKLVIGPVYRISKLYAI